MYEQRKLIFGRKLKFVFQVVIKLAQLSSSFARKVLSALHLNVCSNSICKFQVEKFCGGINRKENSHLASSVVNENINMNRLKPIVYCVCTALTKNINVMLIVTRTLAKFIRSNKLITWQDSNTIVHLTIWSLSCNSLTNLNVISSQTKNWWFIPMKLLNIYVIFRIPLHR